MTSALPPETLHPPTAALEEPLYVEISPLLYRPFTGIGRFSARLVEALARLTPLRLVTSVQGVAARSPNRPFAFSCGDEISLSPADITGAADRDLESWVQQLFRRPSQRHDIEFSRHCPGLFTMWRSEQKHFRREIGLLYDFTPLVVPWTHSQQTCEIFNSFFGETSALFDKAVAISHSTKADAGWLCALPQDDIVVGYPGPSLCVGTHAHTAPVARRDDLILVVSTLEPRKNASFLLDWFLNTDVLKPGTKLYWVGPNGWSTPVATGSTPHRQGQRLSGCGREATFLGSVSDERLCELYRQAAFTIYPSLYEGFGFPVLDSLLHGTPVLTSFNSSLQEFAGPGVFYFDPYDAATLDDAYSQLQAALPLEVEREDLRRNCSWDALARTVLSLCK